LHPTATFEFLQLSLLQLTKMPRVLDCLAADQLWALLSMRDDRCRVRNDNAMLVLGMMLRLSNSLFMEWRACKRRPDHVTTTDFQSALSEDHHRPALRLALSKYANFKRLS
jgi:hypothetical protein